MLAEGENCEFYGGVNQMKPYVTDRECDGNAFHTTHTPARDARKLLKSRLVC
jgi:hypothetical protein